MDDQNGQPPKRSNLTLEHRYCMIHRGCGARKRDTHARALDEIYPLDTTNATRETRNKWRSSQLSMLENWIFNIFYFSPDNFIFFYLARIIIPLIFSIEISRTSYRYRNNYI